MYTTTIRILEEHIEELEKALDHSDKIQSDMYAALQDERKQNSFITEKYTEQNKQLQAEYARSNHLVAQCSQLADDNINLRARLDHVEQMTQANQQISPLMLGAQASSLEELSNVANQIGIAPLAQVALSGRKAVEIEADKH